MKVLSVIVPCYNEEENVSYFYEELMKQEAALKQREIELELIYVDDGSKDRTVEEVRKLYEKDKRRLHLVSFSRNFRKGSGHLRRTEEGVRRICSADGCGSAGSAVAASKMLHYLEEEGYDSVATRRVTRKGEPVIRSFFARRFYALMKRISHTEIVDGARDYRLMKRKVVDAILSMTEYNRFTKGIFGWVGFETKWLEYEKYRTLYQRRDAEWNFWKLFLYSTGRWLWRFLQWLWRLYPIIGLVFLSAGICIDCVYHCTDSDIRRSHIGLAFSGNVSFP